MLTTTTTLLFVIAFWFLASAVLNALVHAINGNISFLLFLLFFVSNFGHHVGLSYVFPLAALLFDGTLFFNQGGSNLLNLFLYMSSVNFVPNLVQKLMDHNVGGLPIWFIIAGFSSFYIWSIILVFSQVWYLLLLDFSVMGLFTGSVILSVLPFVSYPIFDLFYSLMNFLLTGSTSGLQNAIYRIYVFVSRLYRNNSGFGRIFLQIFLSPFNIVRVVVSLLLSAPTILVVRFLDGSLLDLRSFMYFPFRFFLSIVLFLCSFLGWSVIFFAFFGWFFLSVLMTGFILGDFIVPFKLLAVIVFILLRSSLELVFTSVISHLDSLTLMDLVRGVILKFRFSFVQRIYDTHVQGYFEGGLPEHYERLPVDLNLNRRHLGKAWGIETHPFTSLIFMLFFLVLLLFYIPLRVFVKVSRTITNIPLLLVQSILIGFIPFIIPVVAYDTLFLTMAEAMVYGNVREHYRTFKNVLRSFSLGFLLNSDYYEGLHNLKGGSQKPKLSSIYVKSFVSMTRRAVLRFVETLDKIKLPEFVQSQYQSPNIDSIRNTYVFLEGIGFPVSQSFIDSLDADATSSYLSEWGNLKTRILGTSNFALGFNKHALEKPKWLPEDFQPTVPGYIHTTSFTGVLEEILSTSRYWTDLVGENMLTVDGFNDHVEDLWEVVKVQFENSQLSTFDEIYKSWIKKYNMGFGFGKIAPNGRLRQLTRQAVIDAMGGKKPFMEAWKKIFYNSARLVLPAPVFTKWETLKLKKAIARSVRTVVGSAFTHHVMTTVFNYKPNHNYHIWETPMKVGMPINGVAFDRMWGSLLGFERVVAGDGTAFDSTQRPFMLSIIAGIRKKGYTYHKDYHKICEIIDIAYLQLRDQPMGFKNFGDIASKHKGFTTGHSSTTPDNSLALVCNYLMAWRHITGLRAREFMNFNTLVNFGDDHLLAYDSVFGWTAEGAWQYMTNIGTTMRDEAPGCDSLPNIRSPFKGFTGDWKQYPLAFLSKKPLPLTSDVRAELLQAGVKMPTHYATFHDRERLIGKIKGLGLKRPDTLKAALTAMDSAGSYLQLTAHHKDLYDQLATSIRNYHLRSRLVYGDAYVKGRGKKKIPSYNQVLRIWYNDKTSMSVQEDTVETDEVDLITLIRNPDSFGVFVRWLSDLPTLLSPRYANTRWADWLQSKLPFHLSWPLGLISQANFQNNPNVVESLTAKTPYAFLRSPVLSTIEHDSYADNLLRHWIYMFVMRLFNKRKWFSLFDLIRVFDHWVLNMAFILTGQVIEVVLELDLHILDTLVVFLLSYVYCPVSIPVFLMQVVTPSEMVGLTISSIIRYFQPSGSIDFQPLDSAVQYMITRPDERFRFSAPTGTGKSTRMINRINTVSGLPVTVIVPRKLVALSVSEYMNKLYVDTGIGCAAEGGVYRPTDRIVYSTVQSFFLSKTLRTRKSIIVFDECHIDEPHYNAFHNYLKLQPCRVVYMTATPTDLIADVREVILPAVSSHSVATSSLELKDFPSYTKYVVDFCNKRTSFDKILIFAPTIKLCFDIQSRLKYASCVISSKHEIIDHNASVFISTSVCDAGITIPDVGFVFTTDVDITVKSEVDSQSMVVSKPYYYRLSDQTLTQRRGRTGRTSSGVSTLVTLSDFEDFQVGCDFTPFDYLQGLAPAVTQSLPYLPKLVLDNLPVKYQTYSRLFDKVSVISYEEVLSFLESKVLTAPLTSQSNIVDNFINTYAKRPFKTNPSYDPEVDPIDGVTEKITSDVSQSKPTVQAPTHQVFRPADYHNNKPYPPGSFEPGWRNVSGAGLLCGVRCVRMLVAEKTGFLYHFDDLYNQLLKHLPEYIRSDPVALSNETNFFSAYTLDAFLRATFGLQIHLTTSDSEMFLSDRIPSFRVVKLRLLSSHFNYYTETDQDVLNFKQAPMEMLQSYSYHIASTCAANNTPLTSPGFKYNFYDLNLPGLYKQVFGDKPHSGILTPARSRMHDLFCKLRFSDICCTYPVLVNKDRGPLVLNDTMGNWRIVLYSLLYVAEPTGIHSALQTEDDRSLFFLYWHNNTDVLPSQLRINFTVGGVY